MWTFKKSSSKTAEPPAATPPAEAGSGTYELARSLQERSGDIGKKAADVRGMIDDTVTAAKSQSDAIAELEQRMAGIEQSQSAIEREAQTSLQAMKRARATLEQVSGEVMGVVDTLREVADAAQQITRIALQTRLVAFNASVEAKRAGEAGRGFSVVADAVKDLASEVETSSKTIMSTVGKLDTRIASLFEEIHAPDGHDHAHSSAFHQALNAVDASVHRISVASIESGTASQGVHAQMQLIEGAVARMRDTLGHAATQSESFLRTSEHLMEVIADSGIVTPDTPFIEQAIATAQQISAAFEQALARGDITLADLFDERYAPIANTDPAQHTTRFCALTDKLLPPIQEAALETSDKIVFCIATDRNGYIATHNRKYCHPQRPGDTLWNTANSRYRRIFNDRTGIASARNERPFLLQTYRRDMGGGNFVLLKEVGAPIVVQGRHWGGLRLAYKF